jgi:hypothetical protein
MWAPAELPSSNVPGPRDDDIILGRGVPISKYKGNMRFRELIREFKGEYMATGRHHRKQHIVEEVLEKLRERNCRFLSRIETDEEARKQGLPPGSRVWVIAKEEVALSKVKQALREMESSSSPKTPRSPSRSNASARSSRKKKAPVRKDAANAEGTLADPPASPPLLQPVAAAVEASASSSLPATSAASWLDRPPVPTPTMLLPQNLQHGWNLPQLASTAGLSQATISNTLLQFAGQQSLATLLQPPPLQQPIMPLMPFMGSLQQPPQVLLSPQVSLAALNGAAPNLPFPTLNANSPTVTTSHWLEQQRHMAQQQVTQHFDGLLHQHVLQQQQRDLLRQQIVLQQTQNQQRQAQALYLSQLGTGTSDMTRQALLASMGQFNQHPSNLGTMLPLDAGNAIAQVGIGGLPSSIVNPMPSALVDMRAGLISESVMTAPSETRQEAASAMLGDSEGRASANVDLRAAQEHSTRSRKNPSTVASTHDAVSPSTSPSRRRRREIDGRKPHARKRATKSDSRSDESESSFDSSASKSSASFALPKTGRTVPKRPRES